MPVSIAPMTTADLDHALDWAAAEGWNPGLDDAAPFRAADPQGFLMGKLGEMPVACISVVRHSDDFGFLGFYICHPDHRGQGHGWAVWQAGLAHLAGRTVGLDGVIDQQENYRRSGFAFAYRNLRYAGRMEGQPGRTRPLTEADLKGALALSAEASGVARKAYLTAWFAQTATRHTLVLPSADGLAAIGTLRHCREGVKLGPLYARSDDAAQEMLGALAAAAQGAVIFIDTPEPQTRFRDSLTAVGFMPMFETARMYKGPPPPEQAALVFGQATLELG